MIRIFADSTCDLSPELAQEFGVEIVPLHVILGEEDLLDRVQVQPDDIFDFVSRSSVMPKTAAVSVDDAMKAFEPALRQGDEIIVFTISSEMSTTCNSMRLAAQELEAEDRVHVIDSRSLSSGIALQILHAAQMAKEGRSAQEIVSAVGEIIPRVQASFVVDTLTYLHRGGRCSGLAAMAGGMLRLHPRISVKDGRMQPEKKYRGRMGHVALAYAKDMEPQLLAARPEHVFITHSGCEEADVQAVKAYVEGLGRFERVHIERAGSVISCHCGPGTLGVLFIDGE